MTEQTVRSLEHQLVAERLKCRMLQNVEACMLHQQKAGTQAALEHTRAEPGALPSSPIGPPPTQQVADEVEGEERDAMRSSSREEEVEEEQQEEEEEADGGGAGGGGGGDDGEIGGHGGGAMQAVTVASD